MHRIHALIVLAALSTGALNAPEQHRAPTPPALIAAWGSSPEPLRLRSAAIDIRVLGHLAETRATLTFLNPRPRALAGRFYFPLPEGATLSGYALDIDGQMVDASIVEKRDTSQGFKGLVEDTVEFGTSDATTDNVFETLVSPIPSGGTQTIAVRFVEDLIGAADGDSSYALPIGFHGEIDELSIRIEIVGAGTRPKVVDAAGLVGLDFVEQGDRFVAEQTFAKPTLSGDPRIALSDLQQPAVHLERAPDGETYVLIRDRPNTPPTPPRVEMQRIQLLWDTSGSRSAAEIEREISLLRHYLSTPASAGAVVELQVFAVRVGAARRFRLPEQLDALIAAIANSKYDGGTWIIAPSAAAESDPPDAYLLFSDGVHNFGSAAFGTWNAPVYAINSSASANRAWLLETARSSGGRFIDLRRLSDSDALAALGRPDFRLQSVVVTDGTVHDTYPRPHAPVRDPFVFVGRLGSDTAAITLEYGVGEQTSERRHFTVRRDVAVPGDLIARHWARQKLEELSAFPKHHRSEIVAIAKRYGVVTPETALVVLERLEDHLSHRVRPPAALAEMRARYDSRIAQLEAEKRERRSNKIDRVLALWRERVSWWKRDFDYPRRFRYQSPSRSARRDGREPIAEPNPAPPESGAVGTFSEQIVAELGSLDVAALDLDSPNLEMETREEKLEPMVRFDPWDPRAPYLDELRALPREQQYDFYLAQKAEFGRAPGFFFDCADFFQRGGDAQIALRVLSNVAELEIEDPALSRVIAHRLARLDQLDLAIPLFEELVALRPHQPQSFRDLALALAARAAANEGDDARADYERALELLAHVVMSDWSDPPEIEVIALMELNRMLRAARRAGVETRPLDERLIDPLDVDIRVVMAWDAPSTDIDIRVVEPSGEEAFSRNDLTTIGGHSTRDVTDGYGPEVYLLRDAMRGTYRIESEFLGSPAAELIGAVTLYVDIFKNYGRRNEERESVTLRLSERKERFTVAEFEF